MGFVNVISFTTASIVAILFTMSLVLYLRWRSRSYFEITLIFGVSFLLHLIYSILASIPAKLGLDRILEINVMLLQLLNSLVMLAVYYFFHSKKKSKLVIPLGIAGFQGLVCLISIFVKNNVFHAVLPLTAIVFAVYYLIFLLPDFTKRVRFFVVLFIACVGSISLLLHFLTQSSIWGNASWVFEFSYYLSVFIILFDRVVEMMQSVSISNVLDGLTGLYTKRYFISKVNESMRNNDRSAVIFLDIDNFKKLNDTQGHALGDEILKLVGKILKEACEEIGYAGRFGGEEMVVLITDPQSDAAVISERIRDRIERESRDIFSVTASIGYKLYSPDVSTPEEYIKQADIAMYAAKTSGKNRVVNYDQRLIPEVHEPETEEMPIEKELHEDGGAEIDEETPTIPDQMNLPPSDDEVQLTNGEVEPQEFASMNSDTEISEPETTRQTDLPKIDLLDEKENTERSITREESVPPRKRRNPFTKNQNK